MKRKTDKEVKAIIKELEEKRKKVNKEEKEKIDRKLSYFRHYNERLDRMNKRYITKKKNKFKEKYTQLDKALGKLPTDLQISDKIDLAFEKANKEWNWKPNENTKYVRIN